MKTQHKYKLIILGIVISIFSVILIFWINYKNQMDNFHEFWIRSKQEIYYQTYVISKLKMYISLIIPLTLLLPIELTIFISYLKKKHRNQGLKKFNYIFFELVFGLLLTIIVIVLYLIRNAEILMFIYYVIAPLFAVLTIFTANWIIKKIK